MDERKTPCECPMAGFCKRHGIEKSAHLHKLCQKHIGYFNMWEQCKGPKQDPNNCIKQEITTHINLPAIHSEGVHYSEEKLPSTMEMAKNFIGSAAKHITTGMKNVTEDEQKLRLDICAECPYAVEEGSRCGKCGCFLQTKTKWKSSSCPIGKW